MAGGLVAWGVLCFIGVIIYTGYLVWRFARPGTAIPVLALTYLSWLIVFSICFLVPIDLFPDAAESLNDVWATLFWASFLLMWFIIPFASGYYDNGGFTVKQKLWMSLKFNGILVLVIAVMGLAGIIYLTASANWSMNDVSGLLICLSNAWGLTMLVLCAGFGLVEVPRSVYYLSDYSRRTDFIYFNATYITHEAEETRDELAATIKLLDGVEKKFDSADNEKHRRWLVEIRSVVSERELELRASNLRSHPFEFRLADEIKSADRITTNQMFKLHHHSKTLVRHLSLVETQWRDTVDDAVALEAEQNAQADPHQLSWWLKTGRKRSYIFFASLGVILSCLIVFGEITISTSDNVSPLAWIVQGVKDNFLLQQIFTAIPLLYFSVCTYYPLFQLRLSKLYYIGRRRTDEGTLLFNATFLLRVATPLAYNFVLLLRIPARSLENLIGPVTVIPFFGTSFTTIFPIFIAVLNLLVLLNVFGRIGAFLGIQSMKFSVVDRLMDDDVKSQIREGRVLIQNELRKRQREIRALRDNKSGAEISESRPPSNKRERVADIEMGKKKEIPTNIKTSEVKKQGTKPTKPMMQPQAQGIADEEDEFAASHYPDQHDDDETSGSGMQLNRPAGGKLFGSSDGGFDEWNSHHNNNDDSTASHEEFESSGFDFDQRNLQDQLDQFNNNGESFDDLEEDGSLI